MCSIAFSIICSADTALAGGEMELDLVRFKILFLLLGTPSTFINEDVAELSETCNLCKSTLTKCSTRLSSKSLDFWDWKHNVIKIEQLKYLFSYTMIWRERWTGMIGTTRGTCSRGMSTRISWSNNCRRFKCLHDIFRNTNCWKVKEF